MYSPANDYVSVLTDEIALEGLDGITLEALWTRLEERPNFTCVLDDHSKVYFWKIIKCLREVDMYELNKPRPPLVIFNRYDYVDPELGTVLEPANIPEDVYPYCAVEDKNKKVRGSCKTYYERKKVNRMARTLSYEEVIGKWGSKLVIVASQDARNTALMGTNVNPHVELTLTQYCVLERIGRSRYLGEVTQGKVSLQVVVDDPKALFYHRKFLMRHKLVMKQVHHQKAGFHNCTGSLMHLPRFYVERKPKALYLTERVIEILKERPNHLAEYEEIRKELGLVNSLKKLFKTMEFQRYVKTDLKLPYRKLYPSASVAEWKHKGNDKEKKIRAIQLINPDMDVREIWAKDEEVDDDDDPLAGLLDQKNLLLDRSLLSQAYAVVERAGPEGLSQMQLSAQLGVTKLQSRTLCRNLLRKGVVSTFMNDVGRQRVSRYMSRKFENEGKMCLQFMREKNKMLELVGKKKAEKKKKSANVNKGQAGPSGMKRPLEEQNASMESQVKKAKTEETESSPMEIPVVQPGPVPTASGTTIVCEHNIETKVSEEMKSIKGVKNYQMSLTEELIKMDTKTKESPSPNITYRILRRANMIIEAVRAHKVIYDLTKLMKHIKEEEDKEGYTAKIDKKSLLRLLMKLSKDGHIKVIKITLKGGTKEKVLSFVCEPDITTDHTIIQSAVEQAKMKFFIGSKDNGGKSGSNKEKEKEKENDTFSADSINKSMDELKSLASKDAKPKCIKYTYDNRVGKKYGFSPKFVRMQILHQFLYYLVYFYSGSKDLDQEAAIKKFREKGISIPDEMVSEMSHIYLDDVSWKMFIPPLPKHAGWPTGWTIMCDLLLRLPLSIFLKVFNVSYVIPELEEFRAHPIKCHYLVRHLPARLRNALVVARRYIFSIHEVMLRLCYVGLIQFGPQRLKEKDQVFVYLNRRTSLLDTTTSRPSYHQVSEDITYVEHKYVFNSMEDIDRYWYEMWNFCIHTELGGRMHVTGKDIVLEVLQNKQSMIDAIQPRMPSEAPQLDSGEVPGDKRGAAGLDSALFSHLKRNWNWNNTNITVLNVDNPPQAVKPKVAEQRKARLASLKPEPINYGEIFLKSQKKMTKNSSPYVKKKAANRKSEAKKVVIKLPPKVPAAKNVVRHIFPRKKKRNHRPYYDEVDMKALQQMSKLRVEWSMAEDNLLLLCKVASMYLCPNPRKQIINFAIIRDIIHDTCPSSKNKTSRACQRRIMYMMKNPATANSVALHLEDVRQDPKIVEQFKDPVKQINLRTEDSEKLEKLAAENMKVLVHKLQEKFNPEPVDYSVLHKLIPDTIEEFRKQYDLVYPDPALKKRGHFQDVKNVVDVYCAVVNAIIHSSLCCVADKRSYTYQLFRVYQQYPDNLLRSAMAKIRGDQMVSLKKSYMRLKPKIGNYLPVSSSPYQLSISYVYQLQTRYQFNVFYECYQMCKKLCAWYMSPTVTGFETIVKNGGMCASLVELFTKKQLDLDVVIPEQVIILDPRVSEKDETYARIVQRYRDILRSCKSKNEFATSSLLFKKPFLDDDVVSGLKDADDDPDFTDIDLDSAEDQACSTSQQNAIARTASRIALYMMREEIGDPIMGGEKQHAHDFFVVNSCKVLSKILHPERKLFADIVDDQSDTDSVSAIFGENQGSTEEKLVSTKVPDVEVDSQAAVQNRNDIVSTAGSAVGKNEIVKEKLVSNEVSDMEIDSEINIVSDQNKNGTVSSVVSAIGNNEGIDEEKLVSSEVTEMEVDTDISVDQTQCKSMEPSQNAKTVDNEKSQDDQSNVSENDKHSKIIEQPENQEPMEVEDIDSKTKSVNETKENVNEEEEIGITEKIVPQAADSDDAVECGNSLKQVTLNVPSNSALMDRNELDSNLEKEISDNSKSNAESGITAQSENIDSQESLDSSKLPDQDEQSAVEEEKIKIPRYVADNLLPLKVEEIKKVLDDILSHIQVPDTPVKEEEVCKLFFESGGCEEDWEKVQNILEFVKKKKEIGVTMKKLRNYFRTLGCVMPLARMLEVLTMSRVLYRTGVTTVHFVYHSFTKPWLVHSYKLLRLNRENMEPAAQSAVIDMVENTEPVEEVSEKKHEKKLVGKLRKLIVAAKEVEKAVKTLDVSQMEKIDIAIKPWVRVDGSLNRRVLDRLLGAVLGHSMCTPGGSLKSLADRFCPALQPFQVRELLEVLQKLGCVKLTCVTKSCKATLFSKPSLVKIGPADGTEDEDKISVDPQPDAVIRLGQFIGDKSYSHDFLSMDME